MIDSESSAISPTNISIMTHSMMGQMRDSISMHARNNSIIQDIREKEQHLDFSRNKNNEEATVQVNEIEIQINEVNVTESCLNFIGKKK